MQLIPLAALLLASSTTQHSRPIDVVVGESIARVKIGMDLWRVTKLLHDLKPEGVRRGADRTGYKSGPLLIIFDESSRVVTISVDLPKSAGLRVKKTDIPAHANLEQIQELVPGCELSSGSGGRVLACSGSAGTMHFYDSFSDPKAVWAMLP
jgi:hypothetical protein